MKEDDRFIVMAASQAQKAVDFMTENLDRAKLEKLKKKQTEKKPVKQQSNKKKPKAKQNRKQTKKRPLKKRRPSNNGQANWLKIK